ncbi:MAG: hypothetical protein F4137_10185 [Acidobacteria bacterium]|nr:hypothetical protein [Acidobacteriota bacterium]MYH29204.1 hypothetical protein [Acidobacteriota bacterium]
MHDETEERMRQDRETAKRAECFARVVLAGMKDEHGRNLLDFAERTAARVPMQWEKTIVWLCAALDVDGVDDTTLTGIGFNDQEVRHATVVQPFDDESAVAYAERLAAYNEPEAFAVGEAMLSEAADTNPAVPAGTTDSARKEAIRRLQDALTRWAQRRPGDKPPAGGIADERPTALGLADAVRRLEHHARMVGLCLSEMQRGPGSASWGIAERLSLEDLDEFLYAASLLTFNAGAMVIEISNLTTTPATRDERTKLVATREPGTEHLAGIAAAASTLYEIATRLQTEIPSPTDDNQIH